MKLAAAVVLALATPLLAATRALDVTGAYDSNWGRIELAQHGHDVIGTYDYHHGRLHGTLDGNVLRYQWREDTGSGRGVFVVATNGQLIGTWGTSDDVSGGGWQLTPIGAAIAQP
jgi:hypothetical protein